MKSSPQNPQLNSRHALAKVQASSVGVVSDRDAAAEAAEAAAATSRFWILLDQWIHQQPSSKSQINCAQT